jgi:hypothetical protein
VCYSFPIAPSSLLASPLAKLNSQGSAESAVPLLLFPEISNQRTDINHTPTSNLVMIPWLCVRCWSRCSVAFTSRRMLAFLLVRTSTLKLSLAAREQSFFPLSLLTSKHVGWKFRPVNHIVVALDRWLLTQHNSQPQCSLYKVYSMLELNETHCVRLGASSSNWNRPFSFDYKFWKSFHRNLGIANFSCL